MVGVGVSQITTCMTASCLTPVMICMGKPSCQSFLMALQSNTKDMADLTVGNIKATAGLKGVADCLKSKCGVTVPNLNAGSSTKATPQPRTAAAEVAGTSPVTLAVIATLQPRPTTSNTLLAALSDTTSPPLVQQGGCEDKNAVIDHFGLTSCRYAFELFNATQGTNLCEDPGFGNDYTFACPATCGVCDHACSFEKTCYDDDVKFRSSARLPGETAVLAAVDTLTEDTDYDDASAMIGGDRAYQTCREAADFEPHFCELMTQVAERHGTFLAACKDVGLTNEVDSVTLGWSKSCQQTCGPPPECRLELEALTRDTQRLGHACTECVCKPKMCLRDKAQSTTVCQEMVCDKTPNNFKEMLDSLPANVEHVDLANTRLASINSTIVHARMLRLTLSHNKLTSIPGDAFMLDQLEFLRLEHNAIVDMSYRTLDFSTKLVNFDASYNKLQGIPAYFFRSCKDSIRRISLQGNEITSFGKTTFHNLVKLYALKIYDNDIASLSEGLFATNKAMQVLNANDNRITTISVQTFEGLERNLHTLSLARNQLTELKEGIFANLEGLVTVYLSSNSITRVYQNAWPVVPKTNLFAAVKHGVDVDDSNQAKLRTVVMRYNPTECFAGLKVVGSAINVFSDFGVECTCANGFQPQPNDEATYVPQKCPIFPAETVARKERMRGSGCTNRGYKDTCTLVCKAEYGSGTDTYTCNAAGQWVSSNGNMLACSSSNRIRVKPIVLGERFRLRVPRHTVKIELAVSSVSLRSRICVQSNFDGGNDAPTIHFDDDGVSNPHALVTMEYFNNIGVQLPTNATPAIDGYVMQNNSICAWLFSEMDSGGISLEYDIVVATQGKKYMYSQKLEVFTKRYSANKPFSSNISVTAGEKMAALGLQKSAMVTGFGGFPVKIRYHNTAPIPPGMALDSVTGSLIGTPESNKNAAIRLYSIYSFDIVGRDEGSLDMDGGLVAASYKIVVFFPTLKYTDNIKTLTIRQNYDGTVPTIVGGVPPMRFSIKDPATLPPGLMARVLFLA